MIPVWRICASRYVKTALLGEGAKLWGGRWNPPGIAIAYTAATLSLATLELFVNLEAGELPPGLMAVAAEIPDDAQIRCVEVTALPEDWRVYPVSRVLQNRGAAWVKENESAVLRVPSSVLPDEWNYLINPAHPGSARIKVMGAKPFQFDPRMWKK